MPATTMEAPPTPLIEQYDAAALKRAVARRHRRRVFHVLLSATLLAAIFAGVVYTLSDNLLYYRTPTQAKVDTQLMNGKGFRLGGVVKPGSVRRGEGGFVFTVADGAEEMSVQFNGVLPDLFREGQGVVAEGRISKRRVFIADTVLAKHDENYRPPGTSSSYSASE